MAEADPLKEYNRKRDFTRTKEPAGKRTRKSGNSFIVQKHDATRLHYDFRLEVDGVLKSWAVTRGPSLDPADKRLAVRTEDHPLSYASFEGTIPKGEYGGGTVMLWDEGSWGPVPGKSAKDLAKGHLHFILHGKRMKGEWLLIRLKPRPGEGKRENWLLRKIDDAYAGPAEDLVGRELTSIKTGRTMGEIAANAPAISLKGKRGKAFDAAMDQAKRATPVQPSAKRRQEKAPPFQAPQLATLVDAVPTGNGWLHEIKYDGYRTLVSVSGSRVQLFTRTGLDWTDRFAPLAKEIGGMNLPPMLIDGEVVALGGGDGNPDFSTLQQVLKGEGKGALHLFAFDLLSVEGEDLTWQPNISRKEKLAALLGQGSEHVHFSDHIIGAGEKLFRTMCEAGQEGIISKRADAPYRGARTKNWLKVKCTRRQEFVVVGWTPSSASGRALRNILLAQNDDQGLAYAGKVGTGFNARNSDQLLRQLKARVRQSPALNVPRSETRGAKWVRPDLVAEIAFAEFTSDNVVRHGSFLGLREDKKAGEVAREKVMDVPEQESDVHVSNRDRLIFPEAKVTKGQLADYYEAAGAIMLPWIAHRPISLVRCPQGRAKKCFFQKHDSGSFGDHVKRVPIREKDGDEQDYLYVDDIDGLIACVQMGTIEFHGWGSRVEDVEKPDRLIFDLDPDEGLDFDDVKKAARDIRRTLEDIGLTSFPMLSGGKGVHVVVPLTPEAEWPQVKDFADRFARALAAAEPDRFTATMSKAKRKGRIFIDWLRNQRGATAVLPYVVRARENAPVAVPVNWKELEDIDRPGAFTIADVDELITRAASREMRGWGEARQTLPDY